MANFRYFNGLTELKPQSIHWVGKQQLGEAMDFVSVFANGKWTRNWLPVNRTVRLKSNPIKHVCDARCMNATGRNMQCECSCGGKNHGAGAFNCEAA